MACQLIGNVRVLKSIWKDKTRDGIFYNGKFHANLQKIVSLGTTQFVLSDDDEPADNALIGAVEQFINQQENSQPLMKASGKPSL
jgi:predicted secreted protein